jgi:inorganic pyrophosphatase
MQSKDFPAVIEVVVGSRPKPQQYEFDEESRVIRLDRVLTSAVYYNFDYGFIEGTRADDGDHTDAMLLIDERTFPGCHVWARPVGVLRMADEKGVDFKVLCVALADPLYRHVDALRQVSPHKLLEIEQFFQTYKNLEDKSVEIEGWAGVPRRSIRHRPSAGSTNRRGEGPRARGAPTDSLRRGRWSSSRSRGARSR